MRPSDRSPAKMVRERLGHSSITLTMDTYGHLFPRADDTAELASAGLHYLDKWFAKRRGPISVRERVIGLIVPTVIAAGFGLLIYWGGGGFSLYMSLFIGCVGSLMVGLLIQRPKA
ncbi:MAG: hypothetical protein E5X54_08355 [Mesorhizobium sp.]|nr:MAG: hypothetical protein E5X60_20960 [Mesorhizobium sp.]TIQ30989.1 MAG: hypothetical protein E5X54_08355 [Mesorhizobium sp.]